MARQLYILRHAKSAWDTDAASDFERPLAKRGERDAPAMGAWMKETGRRPDHVVSSPAKRAKQTVIQVCRAMDIKKGEIHWDDRVYGADTEDLLAVLSDVPSKAKSVLLVGHNPGLELLFSYLVAPESAEAGDTGDMALHGFGAVKTATLVHLTITEAWRDLPQRRAPLVAIQYPRALSPQPG